MADDQRTEASGADRAGDRRADDRRRNDRRQTDRRLPVPAWRRPWALVSYGVLGALALVLLVGALAEDEPDVTPGEVVNAPPPSPPVAAAPRDANGAERGFGDAAFDQLVLAGPSAAGRLVSTELFCDTPQPITLRDAPALERPIAALRDRGGEVRGADCKWGPGGGGASRKEFLLLVPPQLASAFAGSPTVRDNFVERRRVRGTVEWVGRSRALSLRTVGVLRAVGS